MTARTFPAITLWQPWASLIFAGLKRHETRGFRLPDRLVGPWVAIHAAKREMNERVMPLDLSGLCRLKLGTAYTRELPLGKVLGLVRFGPPASTESIFPRRKPRGRMMTTVEHFDLLAGDWTEGRWAWPILEAVALPEPVPAQGRQLWWRVTLEAPVDLGEPA